MYKKYVFSFFLIGYFVNSRIFHLVSVFLLEMSFCQTEHNAPHLDTSIGEQYVHKYVYSMKFIYCAYSIGL